jgi:MYXO-CTERM domain-containing protein
VRHFAAHLGTLASMSFARATVPLLLLLPALALAGCGGGPGAGEPLGESQAASSFANDQTAFDYFLGKGLTNFQAAGIVGNLDQESGVDPMAMQGGGPGRGIAQWSVGGRWDTDANDNATWYATMQGQSVWSLTLQLDFIWCELTTFSGYGLAALQQTTNVTDATVAFQNDFEGCGTCDQTTRVAYAMTVLADYGSDSVDGGGSALDAGGATTCFVPTLGLSGDCILTSACAALPGHVSTPGYCPGPANIECCTGPTEDGGMDASSDVATPPPAGDSGPGSSEDSATPPPADTDAGMTPPETDGGHGGAGDASVAKGGPGATPSDVGSKGCATAPGYAPGSDGAIWLAGLAWIALGRRRRRS